MNQIISQNWPYAAKAAIQHEYDTDHLNIWITFSLAMYRLTKPLDTAWILYVDNIEKPIFSSAWQDCFTMLLIANDISNEPARVMLKFEGPDELLKTTWHKQWESWARILSQNITT